MKERMQCTQRFASTAAFACQVVVQAQSSLADAEGAEDQIQDVVGCGFSGEFVQCVEALVEIQQDHLVRSLCACGFHRLLKRGSSTADSIMLAEVGQGCTARAGHIALYHAENRGSQIG